MKDNQLTTVYHDAHTEASGLSSLAAEWACNTPHISPRSITGSATLPISFARNGYQYTPPANDTHVSVKEYAGRIDATPRRPPGPPATPPPRGEITCFSRAARARMIRKSAEIRNVGKSAFITLTYPGQFDGDWESVKRDIDVFAKRFLRRFPGAGFMWRMEIKRRLTGASAGEMVPHYHLCVVGLPKDQKWGRLYEDNPDHPSGGLINWVSHAWHNAIGVNDKDHLRAGTNCRRVVNMRHMTSYVAKYAAKEETEDSSALWRGRRWGCRGDLHDEPGVLHRLTYREWYHLRRLLRRWAKAKGMKPATLRRLSASPLNTIKLIGIGEDWTPGLLSRLIRHARQLASVPT